ncbi:MAG: PilZ domain-containing protein [Deltaproteobacteria bacterium]|nr:PilZ domain-containing protein [Deltaproteobacteria bacterium]
MGQIDRSPRERSDLHAVLVDGDVQSTGRVSDISRSGLLVRGPLGLTIGRKLCVVNVVEAIEADARQAEVVRLEGSDGAGLRFLVDGTPQQLPTDVPLLYLAEAWNSEGEWLAPLPEPPTPSACFAVRPSTVERLWRFADRDLSAGRTVLFTNELRAAGERVAVVLVHPRTGAELELPAVVVRCDREPRPCVELAFVANDVQARIEVACFVETGEVRPRALARAADLEIENDRLRERIARLEQAVAWATNSDE